MRSKSVLMLLLNALVVLLIFVSLIYDRAYFADAVHPGFSFNKYLQDPGLYGGEKVEVFGTFRNFSENSFYFNLGDKEIKIYGSNVEKPILGETVLYLDFRKDGIIELIDYHNYNFNYALYALSLMAVLLFIILFFKEWKFSFGGFEDA